MYPSPHIIYSVILGGNDATNKTVYMLSLAVCLSINLSIYLTIWLLAIYSKTTFVQKNSITVVICPQSKTLASVLVHFFTQYKKKSETKKK